jgi:hypothetical protein
MEPITELTPLPKSNNRFIVANTNGVNLQQMDQEHIIPVFAKDNEKTISHVEFIQAVVDAAQHVYRGFRVEPPQIRVSHPVQGRIPEAKDKRPHELLDHEKTLYYERMMFIVEVPGILYSVDGKSMTLCVGGVKSYGQDRLSGKITDQHFKIFVGFRVHVCSNMSVSADGCVVEIKTKNQDDIFLQAVDMLQSFSHVAYVGKLRDMSKKTITREEFEILIGILRVRFYDPSVDTKDWFGDQLMGQVVRGYFENPHFKAKPDGSLTLWDLFNLFTEANKSSYVDTFLERSRWISNALAG